MFLGIEDFAMRLLVWLFLGGGVCEWLMGLQEG